MFSPVVEVNAIHTTNNQTTQGVKGEGHDGRRTGFFRFSVFPCFRRADGWLENRSKFPAKPGKFPASKIPAEGRNPRLSTGNFCRELLFGNFFGPCAAWRPLARSASRLVTGLTRPGDPLSLAYLRCTHKAIPPVRE